MKISRARQKDIDSIVSLNRQFSASFDVRGLEMPLPRYYSADWVMEEIDAGNQYVLRNKTDVIGAMCLYISREDMPAYQARVDSIAVKTGEHCKGHGKRLIDFAKKKSVRDGKEILTVESFCIYGAKEFYLKCGFELLPKRRQLKGHKYYAFRMCL